MNERNRYDETGLTRIRFYHLLCRLTSKPFIILSGSGLSLYGFTNLNYAKRNFDDDGGVSGDGNWKRKGPNGLMLLRKDKKKRVDSNEYKPNENCMEINGTKAIKLNKEISHFRCEVLICPNSTGITAIVRCLL